MATASVNTSNGFNSNSSLSFTSDAQQPQYNHDFPRYYNPLAPAKPFLIPTFDNQVVEALPSEKANRKIRFDEQILVQEIENRYAMMDAEGGEDEEDSYEIEIVDDDGDADFYLEIVDGEVFYVFETEDDISEDEEDSDDEDDESTMLGGDESTACQSEADSEGSNAVPKPLLIPQKMALPNLDDSSSDSVDISPVPTARSGPAVVEAEATTENAAVASPATSQAAPLSSHASAGGDEDDSSQVFSLRQLRSKATTTVPDEESVVASAVASAPASPVSTADKSSMGAAPSAPASPEPSTAPPMSEPDASQAQALSSMNDSASIHYDADFNTPVSQKKASVQIPLVDMVPGTPLAGPIAPASPGNSVVTPRSILKAYTESPRKPATPKKVRDKTKPKEKKEKTFTKTYVRAEQYDGEHVAYSWEKPSWTRQQLRSTDKGEEVRKGGNLANPITFPKKKPANADLLQDEEDELEEGEGGVQYEQVNKEELIRRLKGGDKSLHRGKHRKLKFSINGAKIRDGGDIVQPITKATVFRKPENINKLANPEILKSTALGSAVKEGKDLQQPVTFATVNKAYQWEKPDWAKRLEKNDENNDAGNGGSASATCNGASKGFVSPSKQKKTYTWEKPSWIKQRLSATDKGDAVKDGATLANPITFPVGKGDGVNHVVKPDQVLKPTDKGGAVKKGGTLARPITQLPDLVKQEEEQGTDPS